MQPPHIFSDQASKVNQEIILYRLYFISIFILIIYSWKAAPILGSILWFVFGLRFFSGHFRDGHGRGTGVAATELSGQNHWRNHWPEELPQFQHTKKVVIVHQNGCLVGALSEPRKNSEHFQIANYALPQCCLNVKVSLEERLLWSLVEVVLPKLSNEKNTMPLQCSVCTLTLSIALMFESSSKFPSRISDSSSNYVSGKGPSPCRVLRPRHISPA